MHLNTLLIVTIALLSTVMAVPTKTKTKTSVPSTVASSSTTGLYLENIKLIPEAKLRLRDCNLSYQNQKRVKMIIKDFATTVMEDLFAKSARIQTLFDPTPTSFTVLFFDDEKAKDPIRRQASHNAHRGLSVQVENGVYTIDFTHHFIDPLINKCWEEQSVLRRISRNLRL